MLFFGKKADAWIKKDCEFRPRLKVLSAYKIPNVSYPIILKPLHFKNSIKNERVINE